MQRSVVQWRFEHPDFTALQPFSLRLVSVSGPCFPITSLFFTRHLSKAFFIQGNYKLKSQLLISLVNVQSLSSSFNSDIRWFLSEEITSQKRAIRCPDPTHRSSECYQWNCSESFQSYSSEEKGLWVCLRIYMQKDVGILDLSWHFISLDSKALLSAGRRKNVTHS